MGRRRRQRVRTVGRLDRCQTPRGASRDPAVPGSHRVMSGSTARKVQRACQGEPRTPPRQVRDRRTVRRAPCGGASHSRCDFAPQWRASVQSRPSRPLPPDHRRPRCARDGPRFDVPATGLDVGTVRIDVPAATGRIEGRVWHPKDKGGGPWAFAKGYIGDLLGCYVYDDRYNTIEFVADENGRFHVNGVPAGLHTVGFQYTVFDMDKSYDWSAVVVEGQTTLVRAFEPDAHRELTLAFAIGDGSKGQYESGTGLAPGGKSRT